MAPSPVPADPGWDEDLTWLDRDPEREHWLDRAREHDEPPGEDEEYEDYAPLSAEELAEIEEAAARAAGPGRGRRRGGGAGPGGRADPGRAACRDRPRRNQGRAGQGEAAAGDRGQVRPGGAVSR